jgi:quinol monooxygenase YgiN
MQFNNPWRSFILMATTSLGIHYYIKDGHRNTVLSKLEGVIDLCVREPEFINAIISESPERPNQFALQELWRGTRADFDAVQGIKPYRKAYLADVKQYLEKVDVEWNTPIVEWGSRLTDLNGA